MQILPIRTKLLHAGDSLCDALLWAHRFEEGDILVVSSKAAATCEGAIIDLSTLKPTEEATQLAAKTGSRDTAFIQAVLDETKRLHGSVVGTCPGALLTEVRPEGLAHGSILTANAGLDESNIAKGSTVGWPMDPVESVRKLRRELGTLSPVPSPDSGEGCPELAEGRGEGGKIERKLDRHRFPPSSVVFHARQMRKDPTKEEEVLWSALRNRQIDGVYFRRQRPVGRFILDFYCEKARLGIEVDGGIHERRDVRENDRERQEELQRRGITMLRFRNGEILQNLPFVIQTIRRHLQFPLPSPDSGEGCPELAEGRGEGVRIAVLLSDSCCRPRRLGVTAFALACAGLDPLVSQAGREDLHGRKLRITTEAVADQLATAANFAMGNADQSIPAAVIRDHGLSLSDFCGWVPGIEPEEDLFRGII